MAGINRVKPTPGSPRGQFLASVLSNRNICTDHYRLVLALPAFPVSSPGQFVQIECRGEEPGVIGDPAERPYITHEWTPGTPLRATDRDLLAPLAYLRRPFSIAGRRTGPGGVTEIDIIHRVVGKGTRWMESLAPGASVSILGPLGNGFQIPQDIELALLVGGGVGIPPMFYLAETLRARNIPAIAFVGAQRRDLVPLTFPPGAPAPSVEGEPVLNASEFADHGYPTVLTTDDGSLGMRGFVTAALRRRLSVGTHARTVVFCCGPTPMMRATAKVCEELGVACQVSLEQPMACGMGTCQSCVVRWGPLGSPADQWVYKLTCTDGPVFDAREVRW